MICSHGEYTRDPALGQRSSCSQNSGNLAVLGDLAVSNFPSTSWLHRPSLPVLLFSTLCLHVRSICQIPEDFVIHSLFQYVLIDFGNYSPMFRLTFSDFLKWM